VVSTFAINLIAIFAMDEIDARLNRMNVVVPRGLSAVTSRAMS